MKPLGWSWYVSLDHGRSFRFYGGRLHIPAGAADLDENDFDEWFFRIPFTDRILTVCRIGP